MSAHRTVSVRAHAFIWCLLIVSNLLPVTLASSINYYRINLLSNTAEMILMLSQPVNYEVMQRDQERVLKFNRAVNLFDLKLANGRLSSWVSDISSSYDTLQIELQPDVDMDLRVEGNNLRIVFRKKKNEIEKNIVSDTSQLTGAKSNLALERVNARLNFESGKIVDARDQYRSLLLLHPSEPELMLDLASVETNLYDWREALHLYQQAEVLMPHSLAVTREKQALLRAYGSRVTTAVSYNKIDRNNTQVRVGVHGRQLLTSSAVVFADYVLWDVDDELATRRVNGDIETFEGQRHSLGLGFESRLFDGEQKLAVVVGSKKLGLAWNYQWAKNIGLFSFQADWRVPWYETSEAMAGYGSRDRLALNYSKTFFDRFNLSSSVSVNYYGLDGMEKATNSYRLQVDTRYRLTAFRDGFSVGYSLDKESVFSEAVSTDASGESFVLLPLDDREQHLFTLWWEKRFASKYFFESNIGFEYDRLRDVSSPYIFLNLNYQPNPRFEMNAYIESGLSTYNGGSDEFLSIGGILNWYF